jgi:hypothetical protein
MGPQLHAGHPSEPPSTTPHVPSSSSSAAGAHTPLPGSGVSGGGGAAGHASLLRSLPVAVLADPAPSRPQSGVVLSVAPLLGARPYTDPQVGKWLHVHVRPSVRGLLRIIKVGGVGGWVGGVGRWVGGRDGRCVGGGGWVGRWVDGWVLRGLCARG